MDMIDTPPTISKTGTTITVTLPPTKPPDTCRLAKRRVTMLDVDSEYVVGGSLFA